LRSDNGWDVPGGADEVAVQADVFGVWASGRAFVVRDLEGSSLGSRALMKSRENGLEE
jgi:hypothetical protein